MKVVILLLLGVVSFVAALVGAMAATGHLNKESLTRLVKPEEAAPMVVTEPEDDLSPLLKALKEREEALNKREEEVGRKEEVVAIQQKDLDVMKAELQETLAQVQAALKAADEDRDARIAEVAKSFENMKASNAAEALASWPTEDAADILRRVKDKDRGKILDSMEPAKAAMILRSLQEPTY